MGKLIKILGGFVVLVVAAVVAGVVILKSTDINQYRDVIAEQVKNATGRDLTLGGDLELEVSLSPSVIARKISFANAAWGSRPEMATIERFEAKVDLLPLLSGTVQVSRVVLIKPNVLIETDKSGKGNWVFDSAAKAAKPAKESSGGGNLPVVRLVDVEDATFTYKDGATGKETVVAIDHLRAGADSLSSPLVLSLSGKLNGQPYSLEGQVGAPSRLISGAPLPVDLVAKAGGATVSIKGEITDPAAGKGIALALSVQGQNAADLAAFAGATAPKIGPYSLSAALSDPAGGYALKGIAVKVGSSDLSGDVLVSLSGAVPAINAQLSSNLVDVKDFAPPAPKEEAKAAPGGKLFSADPLPLDGLKAVNATVNYKAKQIVVQPFPLSNVLVNLSLRGGKLAIEPLTAKVAEGLLNSVVKLDSARKVPALTITLDGKGIGLGDALKATGSTDLLEGSPLDASVNLRGKGQSVAALMGSLNGVVKVVLGDGKINNKAFDMIGGDLVSATFTALNPLAKKDPFTVLKCGVVYSKIKDGQATIDKGIAFETSAMNVIGSGTVDLKAEQLDVGIKTEPREGLGVNVGGLASVVRLGGPLSAPGVKVDPLGAGKAALSVGTAIATGGLSLLVGGVVDRATADGAPCDTALGIKSAAKPAPQPTEQQPAAQEQPKSPGGVLEGIGKGLGGLFGGK